jgi:hypothetical protein
MFVADAVAIFRTFNLVGAGTLVGIVIAEAVIILPLVRSFPSFEGVGALRFAGARAWRLAPACGAVAWISGIVIAVLWPWHRLTLSAALTVAGDVLMGAAVAVTYGPYVTIDKCLRGLVASEVPEDVPALFRRMAFLHALRTTLYVLAFVCFVLAVTA